MAEKYQTLYQRNYRLKKRQVTLTLEIPDFQIWKKRADQAGRTVARQIIAEADVARTGNRLPSLGDEAELRDLIRIMRGIGNNLNQVAHNSNRFSKLLEERRARQLLMAFEDAAAAFILRQSPTSSEPSHGRD